jgi:hypothetical protein
MTDPGLTALITIPQLIAAFVLTLVSIRAAHPRRPAVIALLLGVCLGSALTLLVERVFA